MHTPIIVIGAGLAAWTCVRELRKLEASAGLAASPITVVTGDSGDFYAKPSLSNAFAQGRSPAQLVTTPAAVMAQKMSVTLLAHTQVHAIDTALRTISTDAGPLAYRQLVMANGAQPIRVPIGGDQLLVAQAVKTVNSLDDFALFHSTLQQTAPSREPAANTVTKRVLIMGAGLIGCEFANDLVAAGVQVTVVDPSPRPLSALLPSEASEQLQAALAERGVQWMLGTTVERIEAVAGVDAPSIGLPTYRVFLKNGGVVTVHALLSAIGLRANSLLASQSGIACERGIVVNQQLQTSADSVYAIGDAAQYAGAGTLPYVMPIMHAAKALAQTLLGMPSALVFPHMPVAIKTPALPLLVLPPAIGSAGTWQAVPNAEPDANAHTISPTSQWQWRDADGAVRGFCLAGASTKFRQQYLDAMGAG